MASGEPKSGFVVTQSRIALVLSLITLLSLGHQASKFFLDHEYRLASLEEKWVSTDTTQRDLATELRNLNLVMNDLKILLKEVQVRQEKDISK